MTHQPKRRLNSMRHPRWHYGTAGAYFIAICTHRRAFLFDVPTYKQIASQTWVKIPTFKSASTVRLDAWVVMPNHVHGILVLTKGVEGNGSRPMKTTSGTVGALVGTYKAAVAKRINHLRQDLGAAVWQRGYYDHIIRDARELEAIRHYIAENPRRWATDRDNLDALINRMTPHHHQPGPNHNRRG